MSPKKSAAEGNSLAESSLSNSMANFDLLGGVSKELDSAAFVRILRKLIGEAKHLQNNPRLGVHPEEKRAANIVLQELEPYSTKHGGPLVIEELEYVPGRSNLKIVYPGTGSETTSFVGSHFDVVPADPEVWTRDPFSLTEEDGKLYGRGTTDCLGHVALLTQIMAMLGKLKPSLKRSIIVLFIAGEEGGETGVGIDVVVNRGKLDDAKTGPVFWIDSADSQPCCGTSGMMSWGVTCKGRIFHSGFPHKGINSIELANEVVAQIQERFYEDFPPHPEEERYQFVTGSHMKPTQIECKKGSLNQICPETKVFGDIRLSPFYDCDDVVKAVEGYVKDINEDMEMMTGKGPWSKFVLPEECETQTGELKRGQVTLEWQGTMDTFRTYAGIACDLDSAGHRALVQSIRETYAGVKPFSINGSLPLVRIMQKHGFDVQLAGFGLMSVYHGVNEYCTLEDMIKAYEALLRTVCLLETIA